MKKARTRKELLKDTLNELERLHKESAELLSKLLDIEEALYNSKPYMFGKVLTQLLPNNCIYITPYGGAVDGSGKLMPIFQEYRPFEQELSHIMVPELKPYFVAPVYAEVGNLGYIVYMLEGIDNPDDIDKKYFSYCASCMLRDYFLELIKKGVNMQECFEEIAGSKSLYGPMYLVDTDGVMWQKIRTPNGEAVLSTKGLNGY